MKIILFLMLLICFKGSGMAQSTTQSFEETGISYTYEELNEVENPIALLVLFDGGAGIATRISSETAIPDSAVQYQFKVIGIDQSELYISNFTYSRIRTIINHVRKQEGIGENLFIGGFSLGGFTSVRFAEMAVESKDNDLIPKAIFAIDPPLDHLEFVNYCNRELERTCPNEQANAIGKGEANWILNYYQLNFGSFPEDKEVYIANSCYTSILSEGGNARYMKNIPVNMIHEIDMMWLINERCRDLSDTNAFLSSKFINFLVAQGNKDATITLTSNKGYRADGRRHPHSWSIAEAIPTLDWLSRYLEK